MKNIMLSAITSIAKNLSHVLSLFRQRESVRATMSRVLILLMLVQPMLLHATPYVHGAEATTQRGVAKLRSWMPKTVEAKAAEGAKPMAEKAIGIDEWMAQSESRQNVSHTTNNSNIETPQPIADLKNFASPFTIFPTMAMFQSGTSLEMGATGPAGTGPSTAAQAVTLFENAVTAYTPTTTVTYTLSNQQFGPGTVQGVATNSAINFGGSGNSTADSPVGGFNLYSLMNGISGSTNAMYTACVTCAAGTSIDVATDRAISFNVITDAFINAANTNLQALNARVYVGDVTISFNRPVSNPVLQFTGMGGQGNFTNSVTVGAVTTTKSYDMGYAAEFDLVGSGVTLSKLNGNSVLNVTSNSITNSATRIGASSVGSVVSGITRTAASGSVLATGTNITSITLKMYIRGDGGIIQSTTQFPVTATATWIPATADAPYEVKWAIAAGYLLPTPPATVQPGSVAGDTFLMGASIQKPVTVSGTVFNDTNGLSDSIINGTGTNAGGLYALLVDSTGDVVASVAVPSTGIYSFTGIGEGNYTVRLSTTAGVQDTPAPAVSLPATWFNRGEGTAAAGDGTVDGNTAITVAPGVDRTGVNFGIAQPGLSLAKANPASFAVGTAANYTLTVSNAANRPTSGTSVVVNDKLPPNIAYNSAAAGTGATGASCTSSGTLAAGLDLVCTITTAAGIAAGSSAAFTLNVTPQTAAAGVAGINKAAVDPLGGTPVAPSTCTATGTPAGCALAPSITPMASPLVAGYKSIKLTTDVDSSGSITPGDTLTYILQYTNTGAGNAASFQINDVLPSGLTITSTGGQTITLSGAGTSATKNTTYTGATAGTVSDLLATSATLGVGGIITVTIPVTVGIGVVGTKSNQASATGIGLSSAVLTDNAGATADLPSIVTAAPYNLTIPAGSVAQTIAVTIDPTTVTISALPNLKLLKVAPLSVQAGTALTYTMTVANVGLGATSGTISVVDELPTGVTVNGGASGSVALSGLQAADWTCNSDAAAPQTITCTSTTAMVASSGVSIFAFSADVAATVTNNLVNQAKVFGGGDPNKTAATTTGAITACLAASENLAGSVVNAGCAFESTPVINVAGYKSVKLTTDADSSSSITPGDTLTYTLQYTNTGTADATVFQLNDVLPTGLTKSGPLTITILLGSSVAVTNPLYTGAAAGVVSNLLLAGGILKAGGVITLNIPVTVNSGFSGTLNNQATATALELSAAGVKTDNAGATADLPATVTAAPYSLTVPTGSVAQTITATIDPVTVTVGATPVVVAYKSVKRTVDADANSANSLGDTMVYTINYVNTGSVAVPSFQINDVLPGGLTITSTGAQSVTVTGAGTTAAVNSAYTGAASGAVSDLLATGASLNPGGVITVAVPVRISSSTLTVRSNQSSGTGTGLSSPVLSDNAGTTADLPTTVTAAPYNVAVPGSSVSQTITAAVSPTTFTVALPTIPSVTPGTPGIASTCTVPVTLNAKVFLGGAYVTASGLMNDNLRTAGLIPINEPYLALGFSHGPGGGGEITTLGVLAVSGNNAIVDWVLLELRDTVNNVVATRSALVQRDGDVVSAADGVSVLSFAAPAGNYYVSVRHRNHLDVMTDAKITFGTSAATVDFTSAALGIYNSSPAFDGVERKVLSGAIMGLWPGDANNDEQIDYSSAFGGDVWRIQAQVYADPGNILGNANYISSGYHLSDLDLKGSTIFQGPNNDVDVIFFSVLGHPNNGAGATTFIIPGQMPSSTTYTSISLCTPTVAGYKSVKLTTDADSSSSITPGDTLTYTIQYANTGSADATVFQINDVLPTGLTKSGPLTISLLVGSSVAVTNPLYTGAASGVVSDLLLVGGILKANGVITLDIPVSVNSGFSGTLSNQATATALGLPLAGIKTDNAGVIADLPSTVTASPFGLTVPTGSVTQTIAATIDPVTVTVGSTPTVVAFKSVKLTTDADSSGTITEGDTLTWTVQYANTGTVNVPSFQIADQLPSGITITSAGAQTVTVTGSGTSATKDATYTGAALATSMVLTAGATLAQQGTITLNIPVTINAGFTGTLSNQASGSGTGMPAAISTDNAGTTAELSLSVTAVPFNLTIPASSVAQTITATVDPTTVTVAASTLSLAGKVFEDINYGGGAGRDFVSAPGAARPGVRVELYDAAGVYLGFTFTNATGDYTFTGLSAANYTVRVVDAYVTSSRTGGCTASANGISLPACTQFAVQTFRTNGLTSNAGTADANRVGGETPNLIDAGANTTNATLASLTTATNTPQSITPVTVGSSNITGIDFGFNFDTIVSTRDSGQGSLRQFITNATQLGGEIALAQSGNRKDNTNTNQALLTGKETSIFMIPDGTAQSGVRSGLANQLTGGVAIIKPTSLLPTITGANATNTHIDGTTQTVNIGDSNSGQFGTGGTVGTGADGVEGTADDTILSKVYAPEVQIVGTSSLTTGLDFSAGNGTVRGLAIYGFGNGYDAVGQTDIRANASTILIEQNILGTTASSYSDPGTTRTKGSHIIFSQLASNLTIQNNLIGFAGNNGIGMSVPGAKTNVVIEQNELTKNGLNPSGLSYSAAIELIHSTLEIADVKIRKNLLDTSSGQGFQSNFCDGVLIEDNTFKGNGAGSTLAGEHQGILIFGGKNTAILHNVIKTSFADGIVVANTSTQTKISQNAIYTNGAVGIELGTYGTATGAVTPNNGTVSATQPNNGIDYPIFTSVALNGTSLTVKGFVGINGITGNSTFGSSTIELFKADNSPANQDGAVLLGDGLTQPHGEGRTYLGFCTADSNGLINCTITASGLVAGDAITATATDSVGNTSEFNANFTVNYDSVIADKSVKLTTDADASSSVTPGDTLTYTINYVNTGIVNISNFQINDALPAGFTVAATGGQTVTVMGTGTAATKNSAYTGAAAGTISNLLAASATLKVGGVITVTIPVTVDAGTTGTKANQATGTGTELLAAGVLTDNAGVTADLPATVTAAPYNLTVPASSVAQTIAATIDPTTVTIAVMPTVLAFKSVKLTTDVNSNSLTDPGDTLTWSVWYKNTGTIDVTTFQISDALPAGVTITGAGNQTVTVTGTTTATKNTSYTGAAAGAVSEFLSATTTFNAGDLIQIDIPVTVNAGFAGSLINQAIGTGGNLPPAGVFTDNADNVTPGLPSGVTIPTGSAVQTLTPATDPTGLTIAGVPAMNLVKSVTPTGDQQPGTDLTYKIVFTNTGNAAAQDIVIFDPIPNDTDFKLGSATMTLGTTGLTMIAEYSNDFIAATPATATWTYTPVTAGGGADTGYDRNVKAVRWRVSAGTLSQTPPNHTGEVGFIVKIR